VNELKPNLSVVMPAHDEAENLEELVPETVQSLRSVGASFEIVVVDDGSRDSTAEVVRRLTAAHPEVRLARLRRNRGKSTALSVGLDRARGDVVLLMDADGQDDPHQIPALLAALDGGLDLVTGRRAVRNDRLAKRLPSKLYNRATARIAGVPGSDFNSGFKAMRREVAQSLDLYGELHRYIPVLAHWQGFRIGEIDVVHHARRHGTTKFGRSRFWRGLLDLITVKFLTTYTLRPFHLFGGLGALVGLVGGVLLGWMAVLKVTGHPVGTRPALLTGVLCVVVAVQLLSFGLLAELLVHLNQRRSRGPVVEDL
jgi:glycosyltransferase involved in cell wall biosynthesis